MTVDSTKLGWAGVGACGVMALNGEPTFDPPGSTRLLAPRGNPPFDRIHVTSPRSLLKVGGSYQSVENPTDEQIQAADATYTGGRQNAIQDLDEISALEAAGYGVIAP